MLSCAQAHFATITLPLVDKLVLIEQVNDCVGVGVGVTGGLEGDGVGDGYGIIESVTVNSVTPPGPVATNLTGKLPVAVGTPLSADPLNAKSPVGVGLLLM